uniref:Uncharacterized protein n=1 Tax=viral metagenome TaxID=1070528 RepID=A0A6M3J9D2_9ZZZZ
MATAVERLTNPNMWPSPIPGWAQKYILALCDALAQAQDAITRAIDRMAPDAPNHDPHMLCAAVTLMEAKLAQAQQDRDHEQHEKETVAESGQAMVKHLRGKLAQAQQKVREALDDPTAELSDGIDRLVLDLNTEHEQVAQAQQENVGLDRGLTALGRTVSELEDARDENAKLCEEAQQEIERLLERIDRVRDYITTAMRPGSVQAACCETAYDRAHRAGLKHALNALDAEEFQQPARVVKAGALARELARAQDKAIDQMVKGDILAARDVLDEARANPAVQALLRD